MKEIIITLLLAGFTWAVFRGAWHMPTTIIDLYLYFVGMFDMIVAWVLAHAAICAAGLLTMCLGMLSIMVFGARR